MTDDPCDLHDLSNRLLEQLRSWDGSSAPAVQRLMDDFLRRCEVPPAALGIFDRLRAACERLAGTGSAIIPYEMISEVEDLKNAPLQHDVVERVRAQESKSEDAARGVEPAEVQRPAQTIPVTILVVDDRKKDLERISQLFSLWNSDAGQELFDISLVTFPPLRSSGEQHEAHLKTSQTFTECFERVLMDDYAGLSDLLGTDVADIYGSVYSEKLRSLQCIIFDYEIVCGSGDNGKRVDGVSLAQRARHIRPNTDRILLTGVRDALGKAYRDPNLFEGCYWKRDLEIGIGDDIFLLILQLLKQKHETPFWTGLKEFAETPIITCHAMALARGRSAQKSASIADVLKFYKINYFRAEASSTMSPLDSLLHPVGSIRDAQRLAARVFGAHKTLFVTNGTSTANKIVLQTLLRAGEIVLVDRNCHISHHYAIALARARPYYMEPFPLPAYTIGGGITLETIESGLEDIWKSQRELPRAILITNCTFDGIVCDPKSVIRRVRTVLGRLEGCGEERLNEIAFVFDEAWFAFARFHPRYVSYTAMAAAVAVEEEDSAFYRDRLRVYVTQSTHKTLSAFRQASMVHARDPFLTRIRTENELPLDARLEQAFLTHTSTSPHSGIVASLDVARRQAVLEGAALVGEALDLAQDFRNSFSNEEDAKIFHKYFKILNEADLIPKEYHNQFVLDQTKVTLEIKADIRGSQMQRDLMRDHNIQFNKYSDNSALLILTIGMSRTTLENLKLALVQYSAQLSENGVLLRPNADDGSNLKVPPFAGFRKPPGTSGKSNDLGRFFFNDDGAPVSLVPLKDCEGSASAVFVVPYPPGYPVLVPGQIIGKEDKSFLENLTTKEIHGIVLGSDGLTRKLHVFPLEADPGAQA